MTGAGRRVVITDNEIEGFRDAVVIAGTIAKDCPGAYRRACKCPGRWWPADPRDPTLVRVERNYMHHNAREGGGYGVDGRRRRLRHHQGNVFDYNRHAVASDGRAHTGYVARFNYVLQGGFKHGKTTPTPSTSTCTAPRRMAPARTPVRWPAGDLLRDRLQHDPRRAELRRRGSGRVPAFMLRGPAHAGRPLHRQRRGPRRPRRGRVAEGGEGDTGIGEDQPPTPSTSARPATATTPTTRPSWRPATSTATAAPTSSSPTAPPGSTRAPASGPGSSSTRPTSASTSSASPTSTTTASPTCSTATRAASSAT